MGSIAAPFEAQSQASVIAAILGRRRLELDRVCVTWDADLRRHGESWRYHSFRGDAWTTIHKEDRKRYLLNAYRVLLTRVRQGMVIFVPPGDELDPTRAPSFYDDTYQYLTGLGVAEV